MKSYFTLAWRRFVKDLKFSLLHLVGLSIGLACALIIWLWIENEQTVDKFNVKGDRLFSVLMNVPTESGVATGDETPGLLAKALATEMPEVEMATALIPVSRFDKKGILSLGDKRIAANMQFAGKDFFKMFSYKLVAGNKEDLLSEKNGIVLSEKICIGLFNSLENIIGRSIVWNQKDYTGNYIVTGIFKDPPENASDKFDLVLCYDLYLQKNLKLESWTNNDPRTFLLLKKGTNSERFTLKIADFLQRKNKDAKSALFLQRFEDRYLHNHYENGRPDGGRIEYINLFRAIAVFILIIACINFTNLATARAARRMKATGIKKILGAKRSTLILQFFAESFVISFASLAIGILLVILLLPPFNVISGKSLSLKPSADFFGFAIVITFLTGMSAGIYPAFYLSGFKATESLKGKLPKDKRPVLARSGLVVFQFAISAVFIIGVIIIYKQTQLIQHKNLGYQRENVIYFDLEGMDADNPNDYKPGGPYEQRLADCVQRLKLIPGVIDVSNFRHSITNRNGGTTDLSWQGKENTDGINFTDIGAGYGFIETAGIRMKEGRSFSAQYGDEKSKIIFNEAAIAVMGLKNPIGKSIRLWGEDRQIIGVVKNFNFQSLHENLKPCFFDLTVNQRAAKIMIRLGANHQSQIIDRIADFYKKYSGIALEYRFLDDDYQELYASEVKVNLLSKYFAGITIVLSCLGLFGLSAFTAEQRLKEIGIRKVLGASVVSIMLLLYKDFIGIVGISLLFAFPIAWWLTSRWLNTYAYRIESGAAPFVITGCFIFLLTILATGFQSAKAALSNPVTTLKSSL